MAAKRLFNDPSDPDKPAEKRTRTGRPFFASIIGEVTMGNSMQHLCKALEPVLRKVVNEELDKALKKCTRSFTRSSSMRIQALEPLSLQLIFPKKLSLPIFTSSKVLDIDTNPLQLLIVDKTGGQILPATLSQSIKVEVVVLDGDFPPPDRENWSLEEFNANIVKERKGRRPLIHGDLNLTMRDGAATIPELEFTDNSSWIRCRKFRLGARVVPGSNYQGVRIREAITEAFMVKDHRGELYKKHHPPMLGDEVWRLEKIGKDGAFHKKLTKEGIDTVQHFLQLSIVDPQKLKKILGLGMSEKMWEATLRHARTCEMGTKHYIFEGPNYTLALNPICQIVGAKINGHIYPTSNLSNIPRSFIENLVRDAYSQWKSLQEVDGVLNETNLLTQGDVMEEYGNYNNQTLTRMAPIEYSLELDEKSNSEIGYHENQVVGGHVGCSDHGDVNSTYVGAIFQGIFQYD